MSFFRRVKFERSTDLFGVTASGFAIVVVAAALVAVGSGCAPSSSSDIGGCIYPVLPFQVNKADYFHTNATECTSGATDLGSCTCPEAKSAAHFCMSVRMTPMWTNVHSTCESVHTDDITEATIDSRSTNDTTCAYQATQKICNSSQLQGHH